MNSSFANVKSHFFTRFPFLGVGGGSGSGRMCVNPFIFLFFNVFCFHFLSLSLPNHQGGTTPFLPFYSPETLLKIASSDMRAMWLWHLSPHWSPALISLTWLARWVSPSSLTTPWRSFPQSKRMTIPNGEGPFFSQGYTSRRTPLLESKPALKATPWPTSTCLPGRLKFSEGKAELTCFLSTTSAKSQTPAQINSMTICWRKVTLLQ